MARVEGVKEEPKKRTDAKLAVRRSDAKWGLVIDSGLRPYVAGSTKGFADMLPSVFGRGSVGVTTKAPDVWIYFCDWKLKLRVFLRIFTLEASGLRSKHAAPRKAGTQPRSGG